MPLLPVVALTAVLSTSAAESMDVNPIAEDYVRLVLHLGEYDPAYVDAYFGPTDWREAVRAETWTLDTIRTQAENLSRRLQSFPALRDRRTVLRVSGLKKRLVALITRIDMLAGRKLPFDQETQRLYDAVAPDHDAAHFEEILASIDNLLPAEGPLIDRVEDFRSQFVIPLDRLDAVFDAAIAECRRRTLEHLSLPEGERFTVEFVTDKSWSGYNWYQGQAYSLIQVNTDLPIFIERAVDLGCHEGYPGHHTYNALLEQNLVDDLGWVEFSVYPLFSPQSLIAEGSANHGIELAFPGAQRVRFEKTVLFPMAGLDPTEADRYYALLELLEGLSYAGNEAARDYLDGRIDRAAAEAWLTRYALMSPERASQRVDFIETYRGYVINYNLGKDWVRDWVEREAGESESKRWSVFGQLLSSPMGPSELH